MQEFDFILVGAGAANLSLLCLLDRKKYKVAVLESKKKYSWYESMLLPNSQMQTPFLEDLVTLVDPTNYFSFTNYLKETQKLQHFIALSRVKTSRLEFNEYLDWVGNILNDYIYTDHTVIKLKPAKEGYSVIECSNGNRFKGKNIIIGTGIVPYIPNSFSESLCDTLFHNNDFLEHYRKLNLLDKDILVVGGGQSAAEVYHHIFSDRQKFKSLDWAMDREHLYSLDDTPLASEFFSLDYAKHFYNYEDEYKQKKIENDRYLADGISEETLKLIYDDLYLNRCCKLPKDTNIYTSTFVEFLDTIDGKHILSFNKGKNSYKKKYDIIVLCTGYINQFPPFINSKLTDISINYKLDIRDNDSNIYVQNCSRVNHGIADTTLSMVAIRSATIINSALGYEEYNLPKMTPFVIK